MSLNHFSTFIQVLISIRKYPTMIEHFPMHILFSMHFRIWNEFLEFINENQNLGKQKGMNSARPKSGPRPCYPLKGSDKSGGLHLLWDRSNQPDHVQYQSDWYDRIQHTLGI
jgi:hypothetical protein